MLNLSRVAGGFYYETKFLERDFEVDHERTLVFLRNVRRNTIPDGF